MQILRFFVSVDISQNEIQCLGSFSNFLLGKELCYLVFTSLDLSQSQIDLIVWLLSQQHPYRSLQRQTSFLSDCVLEFGVRQNFCSPFSTNTVSFFNAIGLSCINRVECLRRYQYAANDHILLAELEPRLHDRMTECRYTQTMTCAHDTPNSGEQIRWTIFDVIGDGKNALEEANKSLGLAWDSWDIDFYYNMFANQMKRNPTEVELFDLAQSNSEHSRHWFFKGQIVLDGVNCKQSLLSMVMSTQEYTAGNNIIKFSDNSSAILGQVADIIKPRSIGQPSLLSLYPIMTHIVFTAETHNFPTAVQPFSGAATGVGGRIRDVQAVGRGGNVIASTAGYCVGNFQLPGENTHTYLPQLCGQYSDRFSAPLNILLDASDGASDYGNKFGEPIVAGFCRSFGMLLEDGRSVDTRCEWIKPIMFSGGVGTLYDDLVTKRRSQPGMLVVKLGGPVYRIGVGGGAASSIQIQGDNKCELDFAAVQRGDPEMEQKLNRVVRACNECLSASPIASIHDQGAGGNANVIKELIEPYGADIYTSEFSTGDNTLSTLELWTAEYQESNAVLCDEADSALLRQICAREKCPMDVVGRVTTSHQIVLHDNISELDGNSDLQKQKQKQQRPTCAVDLDLKLVLGDVPRKVFRDSRQTMPLHALKLPDNLQLLEALNCVLRLPSVCSKRFLTNKVDRSVTGLIAQQQCVGPFHTPLADAAVVATSFFNTWGVACSIGEQPIKCLLDPKAGARLSAIEAITNLAFVTVSDIKDIKCSVNWMWPAKMGGETARIHDACEALTECLSALGVGVDGGKDSLSMVARVHDQSVKSPGSVVVSTYVKCPDIRRVVTPDLKIAQPLDSRTQLLHVSLADWSSHSLGGSALAQCFSQLGDNVPDVDDFDAISASFRTIQQLIRDDKLLAGHDVSDGGVVTAAIEMALAGHVGVQLHWHAPADEDLLTVLFSECPGWLIQVRDCDASSIIDMFTASNVVCVRRGYTPCENNKCVRILYNDTLVCDLPLEDACTMWEETSYRLELQQAQSCCVEEEWTSLHEFARPSFHTSMDMSGSLDLPLHPDEHAPCVAVIREEGTNGDREMCSVLHWVGFQVFDVTVTDLVERRITLDRFRGVVFPGGFSYADVLGAAVGCASTIRHNTHLAAQFGHFRRRSDVFSLGVCNGCQLLVRLGWIDGDWSDVSPSLSDNTHAAEIRLERNRSQRFESRFSLVRVPTQPRSPLFAGLGGAVLGVWSAHGEGRFVCARMSALVSTRQVALQYVTPAGAPTELYPHNPNGSILGVAALTSSDGRHVAIMPHPERSVRPWQWPYKPAEWQHCEYTPWLLLFRNAFRLVSK